MKLLAVTCLLLAAGVLAQEAGDELTCSTGVTYTGPLLRPTVWLSASRGVISDEAGNVSAWKDSHNIEYKSILKPNPEYVCPRHGGRHSRPYIKFGANNKATSFLGSIPVAVNGDPHSPGSVLAVVFRKASLGGIQDLFGPQSSNMQMRFNGNVFEIFDGSVLHSFGSLGTTAELATWGFLTVHTSDGKTSVYYNGKLAKTLAITTDSSFPRIGSYYNDNDFNFVGDIRDVMFWDSARDVSAARLNRILSAQVLSAPAREEQIEDEVDTSDEGEGETSPEHSTPAPSRPIVISGGSHYSAPAHGSSSSYSYDPSTDPTYKEMQRMVEEGSPLLILTLGFFVVYLIACFVEWIVGWVSLCCVEDRPTKSRMRCGAILATGICQTFVVIFAIALLLSLPALDTGDENTDTLITALVAVYFATECFVILLRVCVGWKGVSTRGAPHRSSFIFCLLYCIICVISGMLSGGLFGVAAAFLFRLPIFIMECRHHSARYPTTPGASVQIVNQGIPLGHVQFTDDQPVIPYAIPAPAKDGVVVYTV